MRFISRSAKFKCFPIGAEANIETGRIKKQGVIAAFTQNLPIEDWEYAEARRHFSFPGGNLEDDGDSGGAPVDASGRVSVFDTDFSAKQFGWSAKLKSEIEQNMIDLSAVSYGQDFIKVDKPATAIPWPSYDEFTAPGKIVEFVSAAGLNPDDVLNYERENKNRESVIAALNGLRRPTIVQA